MQKLTIEQLAELPAGTKVYRVKDGSMDSFLTAGPHPRADKIESLKNSVVLTAHHDITEAIVVYYRNFENPDREQWFTGYDTSVAGRVMREQLLYRIGCVEAVYLTNKKPA